MQDVLERVTDRAMNLMGDRRTLLGGLRATDFCRGGLKKDRIVESGGVGDGIGRRTRRGTVGGDQTRSDLNRDRVMLA